MGVEPKQSSCKPVDLPLASDPNKKPSLFLARVTLYLLVILYSYIYTKVPLLGDLSPTIVAFLSIVIVVNIVFLLFKAQRYAIVFIYANL